MTVYKALKEANLTVGETVVIPGAGGGLGHLACQYAVAMGYSVCTQGSHFEGGQEEIRRLTDFSPFVVRQVVGIDSGEDKVKLLASYGIDKFVDYKKGDVVEQVKALTDGKGAHASIVVASGGQAYEQG